MKVVPPSSGGHAVRVFVCDSQAFPELHGQARILSLVHRGGARASPRLGMHSTFITAVSSQFRSVSSVFLCVRKLFLVLILFPFRVLVCGKPSLVGTLSVVVWLLSMFT